MGPGGRKPTRPNQTPNAARLCRGRQTASDNVRSQKGNTPDRQLRSQISSQFQRKSGCGDSQDVGLEAATI
jgi:hypothetical protein